MTYRMRRLMTAGSTLAAAATLLAGGVFGVPTTEDSTTDTTRRQPRGDEATPTREIVTAPTGAAVVEPPYRGWSSWSMQSSNYPGLNPRGPGSWLHEENVLTQARAMAKHLKPYGYEYVNIDSGWTATWDWQGGFDAHGRQTPNPERFPHGMKYVADEIHKLGLKAGIYLAVGLEKGSYDKGDLPIAGAPECSTHDIVYPDLRTTNGWDSSYKIDFGQPCAQAYVDSQAAMIADWGYDLLKIDGVGPGSFKSGPNYDNRPDVRAWHQAIAATGRDIQLELSWSLDRAAIKDWQAYADGWRIDTDVECYCDTLVTWNNSVDNRFYDVPAWVQHAGPEGWNNLDTVNVGNGEMDGLSDAERYSYMTLWAISAAPLYTGDDMTKLDALGRKLLTNREVLAINAAGRPASPVVPDALQQVWRVQNTDGSYTVALFNLDRKPAVVGARWSDVGFAGPAAVRDVWADKGLGQQADGYVAMLPGHGSRLLRVTPNVPALSVEAEAAGNELAGTAKINECDGCAGGLKVGDLGEGASVTVKGILTERAGAYDVTVSYVDGSSGRAVGVAVNGGPVQEVMLGGADDDRWDRPQGETLRLSLARGQNTLTFSNVGGYGPDIDRITVQAR
ncbi:carbohydrate-binding protein [Actinopolymorpha sp. B17G11]|uniref:alpha-galactosidase D n=1 Tax=Actinopolymorpha sp. B17G11 TaxID=3160861 RepID=UPI0032E4A1FF